MSPSEQLSVTWQILLELFTTLLHYAKLLKFDEPVIKNPSTNVYKEVTKCVSNQLCYDLLGVNYIGVC